jgi:small subunit ribosomal protein S4
MATTRSLTKHTGRKSPRTISEYGKQLREKQKLKNLYSLREAQFRKIVRKSATPDLLIKLLENRLDNVVFRLGFAISRKQARQLVSHGHFLVNGKPINLPSYILRKGDVVKLKERSINKTVFKNILPLLKKQKLPSWLTLNVEKLEGKVVGIPSLEEAVLPVEFPLIFEYYSR